MTTPRIEEMVEEFDQGDEYTSVAPDDWTEENIKGYLKAKEEIRPFFLKALTEAYQAGIDEERDRVEGVLYSLRADEERIDGDAAINLSGEDSFYSKGKQDMLQEILKTLQNKK